MILPDVTAEQINIGASLRDLGANSIDRTDIALQSMEELNIKMPLSKLGAAKNIHDLVELFYIELTQN